MGDALRKVRTGQGLKIPAAAYNAFVDAAMDLKRRQANIARNATHAPDQNGVILIKNTCGEDRERFEVLGLDSPVHGPADNEVAFQERPVMNGVMPAPEKHFCRFALLLEPIAADAMGLGIVPPIESARSRELGGYGNHAKQGNQAIQCLQLLIASDPSIAQPLRCWTG